MIFHDVIGDTSAIVAAVSVEPCILLCSLRKQWYEGTVPCNASAAISSADALFRRKGSKLSLRAARASSVQDSPAEKSQIGDTSYVPLGGRCSLMARKFRRPALQAVLKVAADCERGFGWSTACMGPL